jgi:hypothetical protein
MTAVWDTSNQNLVVGRVKGAWTGFKGGSRSNLDCSICLNCPTDFALRDNVLEVALGLVYDYPPIQSLRLVLIFPPPALAAHSPP